MLKRQARDGLEQAAPSRRPSPPGRCSASCTPYPKDDVRYVPTIEESMQRLEAVTIDQVRKLYEEQLGGAGRRVGRGRRFRRGAGPQAGGRRPEGLEGEDRRTSASNGPFVEGVKGEKIVIETPDKANAVYAAGADVRHERRRPGRPGTGSGRLTSSAAARCRRGWACGCGRRKACLTASARGSARIRWTSRRVCLISAICNPKNIDKVNVAILDETDRMLKDGVSSRGGGRGEEGLSGVAQGRPRRRRRRSPASSSELLYVGRTFAYEIGSGKEDRRADGRPGDGGVQEIRRSDPVGDRRSGRLQEEGAAGEVRRPTSPERKRRDPY